MAEAQRATWVLEYLASIVSRCLWEGMGSPREGVHKRA